MHYYNRENFIKESTRSSNLCSRDVDGPPGGFLILLLIISYVVTSSHIDE